MKTEQYDLPEFWASALINGDVSGMTDDEERELDRFTDYMVKEYGQCWAIDVSDKCRDFRTYHDATRFGVLACDVATYTFDVTPH